MTRRILILGGDGYLGWPTALRFSRAGDRVAIVDNLAKREWQRELGIEPLMPVLSFDERLWTWREVCGREIEGYVGDLTDTDFTYRRCETSGQTSSSTTASSPRRPTR